MKGHGVLESFERLPTTDIVQDCESSTVCRSSENSFIKMGTKNLPFDDILSQESDRPLIGDIGDKFKKIFNVGWFSGKFADISIMTWVISHAIVYMPIMTASNHQLET